MSRQSGSIQVRSVRRVGSGTLDRRALLGSLGAATLGVLTPSAFSDSAQSANDVTSWSVLSLSAAIRAGKVSSEQVVKAYLARIQEVNRKINAVVTVAAEHALSEARKADAELARGELRGILHGVPMTIKDSFDTRGVVSTAGTEGRKAFVPKRDATVVARLKAAGAILLGKTNTPEFTMSYDTRNLVFGVTRNPYNLSKSPGGSSGGAAAAIAAGASPFDMGSDTGGSIRVPSCFCGTAGIKPTTGRMSLTGHIICTGQGVADPLSQVGPMARFVDDLWPLLEITAGPDGEDPAVVPMDLKHPYSVKLNGLRVAFHTNNGIVAAEPEVKRTVEAAVMAISKTGARVEEGCPKVLASLPDFWTLPYVADGGEWVKLLLQQSGTKRWDPHIDWHWQYPALSGKQIGALLRTWQQYRAEMLAWMNRFDVLICPVNARSSWLSPMADDDESQKAFTYTAAYNMTGWPAVVVRGGTSREGVPIGVQVVANAWREDICVAVAKRLETALGGWQKPRI